MNNNIGIFCNCGCDEGFLIRFRFEYDDDDSVYISTITPGFYAHQCGFLERIKRRIKSAWFMLRGKEFYLHEIVIDREQWHEFVESVNKVDI